MKYAEAATIPGRGMLDTLTAFVHRRTLTGFNKEIAILYPRVVAALQPWAQISERLRRISN